MFISLSAPQTLQTGTRFHFCFLLSVNFVVTAVQVTYIPFLSAACVLFLRPPGGSQFRAFLLLKALQTVAQTYDAQRKLRATRADPSSSVRGSVCGLRALTVSLTKLLVGPSSANINNCHGSCAFPLTNGNNHAILLNSHIESGNAGERLPCCVPVAYEALEVVDWNADGTFISIKPDAVARECGCR